MSLESGRFFLLLGGSFNPPHSGHFRIAVETSEALGGVDTLFMPCANPPHKRSSTLLPFDLRCAMLRAAIDEMASCGATSRQAARFDVCEVENERPGLSYTVDTLDILARRFPGRRPAFVLGSMDYVNLPTWERWKELPEKTDLVILPRSTCDPDFFSDMTETFWPDAVRMEPPLPSVKEAYALPGGGKVLFLPQPLLEVSSSLVRERALAGRSLHFLVPSSVLRLMDAHKDEILSLWSGGDAADMGTLE